MVCSNCLAVMKVPDVGLTVHLGLEGETVAALCDVCVKDVLMLKIVLSRKDATCAFGFEGYLPVSVSKTITQ